jgi:hypothetical protein
MDENAPAHATDDASPSPFRRFPYVQLVFCVACLTMTAWTWMRYSYAWDVSRWVARRQAYQYPDWPQGAYVTLRGVVVNLTSSHMGEFRDGEPVRIPTVTLKPVDAPDDLPFYALEQVFVPTTRPFVAGEVAALSGRVHLPASGAPLAERHNCYWLLIIDGRRSRIASSTVAGLVVGAMGVFVFGLYLRRWVKERRAG